MGQFLNNMKRATAAYWEAHLVMSKHRLLRFLWVPGLVTALLGALYAWATIRLFLNLEFDFGFPVWLDWLEMVLVFVAKIIFWPLAVVFFLLSYRLVAQIFLSPVLSYLSELVEFRELKGHAPKTGLKEFLADIRRSVTINLRILFWEILLCFFTGLIPVVGAAGALGISSYFCGFNFMDYTLERRRLSVKESADFVRRNNGSAVGLGMVCVLGMMVPLVGWFFMPTYATVAATLETCRLLDAELEGNS
jgi:CysZ protein